MQLNFAGEAVIVQIKGEKGEVGVQGAKVGKKF